MIARLLVLIVTSFLLAGNLPAQASDGEQLRSAIVQVRAKILPDARSLATLGPQREGTGAVVREGYVATIGYLVIEAETIEVVSAEGRTVPATLAGYDHASGFALLKLLAPIAGKPLALGDSSSLAEREPVAVAGAGGVQVVRVVSRRPFSGSWEYQLDSAIYTFPPVPNWSGAALLNVKGELLGLGSLIVGDALGTGAQAPGNMFVPVDLLKGILDELIARGKPPGVARPWLGVNTEEMRGRLFVTRVSPDGPADRAGIKPGDIVVGVGAEKVASLAELYRKVWARGAAGVEVPLTVLQGSEVRELKLRSIDRVEYFRERRSY